MRQSETEQVINSMPKAPQCLCCDKQCGERPWHRQLIWYVCDSQESLKEAPATFLPFTVMYGSTSSIGLAVAMVAGTRIASR